MFESSSADDPKAARLRDKDFGFFFEGLQHGRLLVQQCAGCGVIRNPPAPMCAECNSLEWEPYECSGRGEVHSYTTHHHPPVPGFQTPYTVVLADMEEGFRLIGMLHPDDEATIGTRVAAQVAPANGNFRFRVERNPAASPDSGNR